MFLFFTVILSIMAIACTSGHTVIKFENRSEKFIDSAVIHVQDLKVVVTNISPHTEIVRRLSSAGIKLNKHDVTIRVYLYDKAKSKFIGGFYYNDLSGALNDKYTLTLREDLNTVIRPE